MPSIENTYSETVSLPSLDLVVEPGTAVDVNEADAAYLLSTGYFTASSTSDPQTQVIVTLGTEPEQPTS